MRDTVFALLMMLNVAAIPHAAYAFTPEAYYNVTAHVMVAQPAPAPDPKPEAANEDKEKSALEEVGDHLSERGEKMAAEEEATEVPGLVGDATKVYSEWKTSGALAGLLALVSLLMGILRFGPVNDFFRSRQIMWLKPILAAVFGGVGAGIAAAVDGAGVGPAIVAGLLAGLGAVGLYEVTKRRKAENRAK